ncbi:hypothetical protein JCM10295v2_006658 [Rhodotorula toruloides]
MSHEDRQQANIAILRIKRKRTHQPQPLDALVFDQAERCVKRRRSDKASSDAAQASTGAPQGIFRFAETVPIDSFSTPSKTRSLRDRIQSFLAHPPPSLSRHASSSSLRSVAARAESATPQNPHPASAPGSPTAALKASGLSPDLAADSLNKASQVHAEARVQRYRIVEQRRAQFGKESETTQAAEQVRQRRREDDEIRRGLRPPRVMSAKDLEQKPTSKQEGAVRGSPGADLRIYDAVEEGEERSSDATSSLRETGTVPRLMGDRMAMGQFGDMLKEYLTLQESITPSTDHNSEGHARSTNNFATPSSHASSQSVSNADSDDDFVYDVYYRDTNTTLTTSAMSTAQNGEGGWDVSSVRGLRRIGQLAGMQDLSDDDDAALLVPENDVDPSTEEEDLADQDSNEENDYRNDYPSDEDPASDNFANPGASVPLGWREKRIGADWDSDEGDSADSDEGAGWSD